MTNRRFRGSPAAPLPSTTGIRWRWNEYPNTRRVWHTAWAGDQFEILGPEEFADLVKMLSRFGFAVNEAEDD